MLPLESILYLGQIEQSREVLLNTSEADGRWCFFRYAMIRI